LFFFSSRRRHTRSYGDWSSDVCSSDLPGAGQPRLQPGAAVHLLEVDRLQVLVGAALQQVVVVGHHADGDDVVVLRDVPEPAELRSEERRVGKEWRRRGGAEDSKKKEYR